MIDSPQFHFFSDLLVEIHIPFMILRSSEDLTSWFSVFLNPLDSDTIASTAPKFKEFTSIYRTKTIYRIQNFCFYFLLFRIPDSKNITYFAIGPYMLSDVLSIYQFAAPEDWSNDICVLDDEEMLLKIVNTFTKHMFDTMNTFPLKNIKIPETLDITSVTENFSFKSPEDPMRNIRILEECYQNETELLKIVRHGQWHKAQALLDTVFYRKEYSHLQPWGHSLEFNRNQSIELNTLLRKSAEFAGVHPLHIENLSSQFLLKISRTTEEKDVLYLHREMIRKYCQLVQTHSLKGYSPIVQKVLTYVSSNLSEDLTLNAQAKLLNVNPSYLSALFKKETGMTLTEYVKQKRIKHGIFLLINTDLQIQVVAQCCGIADVNYFTKIFKKYIGKTPKEYRDEIRKSEAQVGHPL